MSARLSPRDRRTLLAGAAAIVLLVLLARGLPAWRRWDAGAAASAAEMTAEASRAEATVRLFPAALDSLEARRERLVALGRGVLAGGSTAGAGAELASLLAGAAARSGVQLGSVQVRADTASAATFVRVSVRADATGDLPGLLRLLALLEGGPELLAVRDVAINQPQAGGPAEQPEALRMELSVEALGIARGASMPRDTAAAPREGDASPDAPPLEHEDVEVEVQP